MHVVIGGRLIEYIYFFFFSDVYQAQVSTNTLAQCISTKKPAIEVERSSQSEEESSDIKGV